MSDQSSPLVFLDANILAKPVTRTLLMFAAPGGGYSVIWSTYVENEAERHRRGRQASLAAARQSAGMEPYPSSDIVDDYPATSVSDRQVLADAVKVGALFIITEDVDDFGETDLVAAGISAVNPDIFLAGRVTTSAFHDAVVRMATAMKNPPRAPEQLFMQLGRQHPRAVTAHRAAFDISPMLPAHHPPAALFRGHRCLRCLRIAEHLSFGQCDACLAAERKSES